ncbi:MAG TPA: R3H domain-containing nucleic acid-binding protein [Candidatus Dormibacteraeota bacterium]|nr:R3H domain-containing nucleic acid-binding protein [Candidatus Dormibacteraeota bacterium]
MAEGDLVKEAEKTLADLLAFFEVNPKISSNLDGETLELLIEIDQPGRLIGHHGDTLKAIQHTMNMIVKRKTDERIYINIDVSGYKKARAERLVEKAKQIAEKVKEDGQEAVLSPMTPAERRLVHTELAETQGITTESRGEGNGRRLVIKKSE